MIYLTCVILQPSKLLSFLHNVYHQLYRYLILIIKSQSYHEGIWLGKLKTTKKNFNYYQSRNGFFSTNFRSSKSVSYN